MALTKEQKTAQVTELTKKFQDAESVMFTHYIGLSVTDVNEMRRNLREKDAEMKVGKKTLMKIAAEKAGLPALEDHLLEGAVGCIFSYGDPLAGAQETYNFGKNHEHVEIVGGIFEGKILSKEEATELAKMPSREVLLATFVGMLQSPLSKFAALSSTPLSGFARAMSELADKGGTSDSDVEASGTAAKASEVSTASSVSDKETETQEQPDKTDSEEQATAKANEASEASQDEASEANEAVEAPQEEGKPDTA